MDPMRQGQQNRRGRGRNNHNNNNNNNQHRKGGQNPLSRSYESTGPDTKIRGTPAHIAEKYMQLARDALSSGDPVLAENYLQHAEHYNRIIMTYREQQIQNGEVPQPHNGQIGRFRPAGMSDEEFAEEEGGDDFAGGGPQPQPRQVEPQPRLDGRYDDRSERQPRQDQPRHQQQRDREPRGFVDRGEGRNFQDRGDQRDRGERSDRDRGERFERRDRPERGERTDAQPERVAQDSGAEPARRRERAPMPAHEQPEFLRRPVRRPRKDAAAEEGEEASPAIVSETE
jgi:hypothetical protein